MIIFRRPGRLPSEQAADDGGTPAVLSPIMGVHGTILTKINLPSSAV
jgi:hypothetical protein